MKIRSTLKYQLNDYLYVLIIMYAGVYLLAAVMGIVNRNVSNCVGGGFEEISLITIFVLGISTFRPYFQMFSVNGISRRSVFSSITVGFGITAGIMSLADTLNTLLFSSFMKYHSMVYQFYQLHHNLTDTGSNWVRYTFSMLAQQLLWQFFAYFWIAMIGLFAANLFYRISKQMKIAVFIGVPVLCFFILPLLDENLWNHHLARGLVKTVNLLWGFSNDYNVFTGALSMLVLAAACGVLIWLLMRRMNLKNAKEAV